jgi:hypothetical protein
MANALRKIETVSPDTRSSEVVTDQSLIGTPVHHAYRALQFGFVAAPLIAGFDKFFHVLVNWDQYLAPIVPRVLGINGHTFMLAVGVIEIVAGIGVALKPKIFGYVVSAWLLGIVGNLLMSGQYFDIALRDFGLALGAFALGRLSVLFDRRRVTHI